MKDFFINDCAVFSPKTSSADYHRIPSLILTDDDVLIACADARYDSAYDNPNRIDKAIRRSFDFGATWEDQQIVVECSGRGRRDGEAAIDPAMLYDSQTKTVWMIYSHTPAGIGLLASHAGKGCDEGGNRYVYDILKNRYLLNNGKLIDKDGTDIGVEVAKNGNVLKDGNLICNIYASNGEYLVERTSYLEAVYSADNGATWSEPIDLTHMVKEDWMRFIGAGPGVGIQLKGSVHNGRLIFPIYFSNDTNSSFAAMSCALIYSDDHGKTWKRSVSPNDGRIFNGKTLSAQFLQEEKAQLTESQIIELDDSSLMYFMRNHSDSGKCAVTRSFDGGESFSEVTLTELNDPICQSSVVRAKLSDSRDVIVFVNPDDQNERKNGTVKLSFDSGKTWSASAVIHEGDFMYSSTVVFKDDTVGVLFEGDEEMKEIHYVRFPISAVENK